MGQEKIFMKKLYARIPFVGTGSAVCSAEEVLPASQREERLRMRWRIYRAVIDEGGGGLNLIKTTIKKRGLLP